MFCVVLRVCIVFAFEVFVCVCLFRDLVCVYLFLGRVLDGVHYVLLLCMFRFVLLFVYFVC